MDKVHKAFFIKESPEKTYILNLTFIIHSHITV